MWNELGKSVRLTSNNDNQPYTHVYISKKCNFCKSKRTNYT